MLIAFQTLVVLTVGAGLGGLFWSARRSGLVPISAVATSQFEPDRKPTGRASEPCEHDLPATMPGRIERFVV